MAAELEEQAAARAARAPVRTPGDASGEPPPPGKGMPDTHEPAATADETAPQPRKLAPGEGAPGRPTVTSPTASNRQQAHSRTKSSVER